MSPLPEDFEMKSPNDSFVVSQKCQWGGGELFGNPKMSEMFCTDCPMADHECWFGEAKGTQMLH